jgi:hypothetical protein
MEREKKSWEPLDLPAIVFTHLASAAQSKEMFWKLVVFVNDNRSGTTDWLKSKLSRGMERDEDADNDEYSPVQLSSILSLYHAEGSQIHRQSNKRQEATTW